MKARIIFDWVINNKGIEIRKDTIIDVNTNIKADAKDVLNIPEGVCYLCRYDNINFYVPIIYLDIDFSEKDIDWEQRRYELTKAAIPTAYKTLIDSNLYKINNDAIALQSVNIADAILNKLR